MTITIPGNENNRSITEVICRIKFEDNEIQKALNTLNYVYQLSGVDNVTYGIIKKEDIIL